MGNRRHETLQFHQGNPVKFFIAMGYKFSGETVYPTAKDK
jgi:hypothetical protein